MRLHTRTITRVDVSYQIQYIQIKLHFKFYLKLVVFLNVHKFHGVAKITLGSDINNVTEIKTTSINKRNCHLLISLDKNIMYY